MTEKEMMAEALISKEPPTYSRAKVIKALSKEVVKDIEIIEEFVREEIEPRYNLI